ncbi:MAG: DUF4258 domain-containing protein [Desulfobacterales bacterium]|jgi:hypothetical protein|nr:DUF4258 domain-containing protein [Desulfobacterales bacterium]MDL2122617.1 DUF4258 domain-containing protein [Deltaproteobacteria bacterium]
MIEQKDIKFSRHSKRRMKLYGISEEDVLNVLRNGRKETSGDGKIFFLHDINEKFKYPIKVITVQGDKAFVIVSAYPLKKRRKK